MMPRAAGEPPSLPEATQGPSGNELVLESRLAARSSLDEVEHLRRELSGR